MNAAKPEKIFYGNGVSPGVVVGAALRLDSHNRVVLKIQIDKELIEEEVQRFRRAVELSREQLELLRSRLEQRVGPEHGYILDAHLLMLEDQSFLSEIASNIRRAQANAEWAVRQATEQIRHAYASLEDEYFRERGHDFEDVAERILLNLSGDKHVHSTPPLQDLIIVSRDFNPSTFATLDLQKIKGLVLESGGRTSHTAILARSLRLPALMEVRNFLKAVTTGDAVLVDGDEGQVIVNPSSHRLDSMRQRLEQFHASAEVTPSQTTAPALTKDGVTMSLRANVELPHEVLAAKKYGAEGIGLFRSEFLFFAHPHGFPLMDEQLETYRMLVREVYPHPVNIRTLDVGADKILGGTRAAEEANPSMGLRGIRLSLVARGIFETQIEAILRASTEGKVEIALPMVATVEEIWEAKRLIEEVRARVPSARESFIPIGAMIEIPAAVLMVETLAREVDFFCVGTNDLIQYTLAVDRGNPQVAHLYQPLHPSILRCLNRIAEACNRIRPVRICGEIASNPFFAVLLLGMGFTQLSMNAFSIPVIREVLGSLTMDLARRLVDRALACSTAREVGDYLVDSVTRSVRADLSSYVKEITNPTDHVAGTRM